MAGNSARIAGRHFLQIPGPTPVPDRIMRAMEIEDPLSVDVDENGEVHWRQDELGQTILNPRGRVFTINASDAMKFKFAKGIAANREELAKKMGLQDVE